MRLIKRKNLTKKQVKRIARIVSELGLYISTILSLIMFIARLWQIADGQAPTGTERLNGDITALVFIGISAIFCIIYYLLYESKVEK